MIPSWTLLENIAAQNCVFRDRSQFYQILIRESIKDIPDGGFVGRDWLFCGAEFSVSFFSSVFKASIAALPRLFFDFQKSRAVVQIHQWGAAAGC